MCSDLKIYLYMSIENKHVRMTESTVHKRQNKNKQQPTKM